MRLEFAEIAVITCSGANHSAWRYGVRSPTRCASAPTRLVISADELSSLSAAGESRSSLRYVAPTTAARRRRPVRKTREK